MSLMDSLFKFLGTKWFTLILGLGLTLLIPFTYHNFEVVWKAAELSGYWYLVLVFAINVISVGMCAYKFMGQLYKQKPIVQQEW